MIEGKVAAILNSRELVINRGSADGVEEGMKFAVLDPSGNEIMDPESGRAIGSVFRTKINVRIVEVQPHLSVGRTYEMTPGRGGAFSLSIADYLRYEPPHPRTLRTDEAVFQPIKEEESYVKRGDAVRQLPDEEEPEEQ